MSHCFTRRHNNPNIFICVLGSIFIINFVNVIYERIASIAKGYGIAIDIQHMLALKFILYYWICLGIYYILRRRELAFKNMVDGYNSRYDWHTESSTQTE